MCRQRMGSHSVMVMVMVGGEASFFPGFFEDFFPSFLVREDPILSSSVDEYCCTYWEDVGNSLPLCEG